MSRIRTVKPEFWQSPKVVSVCRDARLCFLGLLNEADDEGRLRYSAKRLAGVLFGDDDDVTPRKLDGWVSELERAGMVSRYAVGGEPLLLVVGFTEHQRINRASESKLPAPFTEGSVKDHGTRTEDVHREQGPGNRERNREQGVLPATPEPIEVVFDAWKESTGRNGQTQLSPKRKRRISDALAAYPLEDVIAAVRGWRHSPHHRGENERRTVYNELELLLRDPEHIEKFRDLERQAPSERPAPALPRSAGALQNVRARRAGPT